LYPEASLRFRYSAEENGKLKKIAVVYTQSEHGINFQDVEREAVYIVEKLRASGHEAYIVGGAVRDLILGKKPKDFDIVSEASPVKIKKIFRNARVIGHRFRLVHVYFGAKIFEVSTFRSMKDGPTSNTFGTIDEDVRRRDFTLNALFYDPLNRLVIDYVGGMKDIKEKKIRPIIDARHIFVDDPVRMIRAVKYAAQTAFSLPFTLKWKIRRQSRLLASISPSRLTEEIFKILHSSRAGDIVASLDKMGLYRYLQPEAAELFKARPGFKAQYLKTMAALNQKGFKNLPGEAMAGLVRDYLEENADWSGDDKDELLRPPSGRYKEAFAMARKFVLPMNPPRVELERAVRLLFAEHGVNIKKLRLGERKRYSGDAIHKPETAGAGIADDSGGEAKKRRRRPRRRTGSPEEQAT
jgi:poly(A) polymerase